MEIEPKPPRKKIFDKNDPHFSAPLLIFSLITAGIHSPYSRHLLKFDFEPVRVGMLAMTFVFLLISLKYPEKPIQVWNLALTLAGLSILFSLANS